MENRLLVTSCPHLHGKESTRRIMLDVIIALIPSLIVSCIVFGMMPLVVTLISIAACVAVEWFIQKFLLKGECTLGNLSAVVTGILLAFNIPFNLPIWQILIGAVVAIGVGKMTFGGLGRNPFNPALVGRVFLLISFPVTMTTFPLLNSAGDNATSGATCVDVFSGATPLTAVKEALKNNIPMQDILSQLNYSDLLLGIKGGSFGELAAFALILGGIYLLIRRVITWHTPVAVLGSMALFAFILNVSAPESYMGPAFHLLTGGALLGAIFMATDYSSSPMTRKGMLIYGVGIGVITMLIRVWGAYPEGMSFAILIMNAVTPLINKYVKPRRYGMVVK